MRVRKPLSVETTVLADIDSLHALHASVAITSSASSLIGSNTTIPVSSMAVLKVLLRHLSELEALAQRECL